MLDITHYQVTSALDDGLIYKDFLNPLKNEFIILNPVSDKDI